MFSKCLLSLGGSGCRAYSSVGFGALFRVKGLGPWAAKYVLSLGAQAFGFTAGFGM